MKFTLSWLKTHLDTEASLDRIAERLTMLGLEVEAIVDPAAVLAPFTVARVVEAKKHPNADRLSLCLVDTGTETVQVVCGAPNARTGMKGVFAPAGSHIPGTNLDLKKGMIRGEESNGMLCSEREMGLSDAHEGIIELPEDAPVGAPFARYMGLDDPLIEIAVTPNRQDCLGVHGIARDLAAAGLGRLKPFDAGLVHGTFESPLAWHIDLPAGKETACPMVVGRYFRNIRNGPSPAWLQERLRAIGLRPISALVDITNFVTYDLGRPLHVFDADKLAGDTTMRLARDGEEITALDGKTYALDPEIVVIADAEAVHGIGGIMGGAGSGCTEETVNAFLEVALFDPVRTAVSGRKLGIESDARYRFERGVDPESAIWGAEVAARLVLEFCGGEVSEPVSAGTMPDWQREVALRPARVGALGGVDVSAGESRRILEALGYRVTERDGIFHAKVPSWRVDVAGEADLVEDVLRVHGYDRIPVVPLPQLTVLPRPARTPLQRRPGRVRRTLAGRGMLEVVTWSFVRSDHAAPFAGPDGVNPALRLANPISSALDVMRPSILPNLVDAARRNGDRGFPDLALFEVGPQYADDTPKGQAMVAAGLRAGNTGPRHWKAPPRPVDVFDAKADALAALAAAGAPVDKLQVSNEAPSWYHPGRAGGLCLGPKLLARFGALHPRVLRTLDAKAPIVGFEVLLDAVPAPKAREGRAQPLLRPSPFQPVVRDFAFVVDADLPAETLMRAARGADKHLIADVSVFDVYAGAGIPDGKTSLAISVILQPTERTLTDSEIDAVAEKIVANVAKRTGGVLRT